MPPRVSESPAPFRPSLERVVPISLVGRRMILRMAGGFVLLLVVVAVLGALLREPIHALSEWFVARWGLHGVFVGTLLTDASPVPLINEPLLLFAHAAGVEFWRIWLAGGTASMGSGMIGYWLGRWIGRRPLIDKWIRHSGLRVLMEKRGASLVLLAAVTPLPFAASAWTAGACKIPFGRVAAACSGRFIKVGVLLGLIVFGWSLT